MANVKISQLPSLSTMTNVAQIPVVAGGVTYQITGANLQNYFVGTYGNANVVANLAALGTNPISTTGNITAGTLDAVDLVINRISSDDSSFVTIEDGVNVNGTISATGNISGNYFIGNGSLLTGISNTGNVTFSGETVIGTGTSNLISGLYLAPSSSSANASMYLRVRGNINDEPTHIHFDTGNNAYYNQFIGDDNKYIQLANTGNIIINSNDGGGNSAQWIFDAAGKITLPNGASLNDTSGDSVVFGQNAGLTSQAQHAVAIGINAGREYQGEDSIAIGYNAGYRDQQRGVAIGWNAGQGGQLYRSVSDAQGGSGPVTTYFPAQAPNPSRLYVASTTDIETNQRVFGNNIQANTVVTAVYPGEDRVDITPNYTAAMSEGDPLTFVGVVIGINDASNVVVGMRATGTDIPANTFVQNTGCSVVTLNQYPTAPLADSASIVFTVGQGFGATAVGYQAGSTFQGDDAVAVGRQAGHNSQNDKTVAVGGYAGYNIQGANAVAVGYNAGQGTQGINAVAVGYKAGQNTQGARAVAIGEDAGYNTQGEDAVAVGQKAGFASQGQMAIAIGNTAGYSGQAQEAVAIGYGAGLVSQQLSAVAIGANAASYNQGSTAVAIGQQAGNTSQGGAAVAVGVAAGYNNQQSDAVAIGSQTGYNYQGDSAVAIGSAAGQGPGYYAVYQSGSGTAITITPNEPYIKIGQRITGQYVPADTYVANIVGASLTLTQAITGTPAVDTVWTAWGQQGLGAVAIGSSAGYDFQGNSAVAIGNSSGSSNQSANAIAIGTQAGFSNQGSIAVAIGSYAGNTAQGNAAVAVGAGAGYGSQGNSAVAVGYSTGESLQGNFAVAIGAYAGTTSQGNNSIIINATGAALEQTTANTFTVAPVRNDVANIGNVMFYNATSKEITYGNVISVAGNITGGNITTAGVLKISGVSAYIDVSGTGYIQDAGMGEMQISTVAGKPLIINTNAGAYGWNFGTAGNLTLPNGGTLSGTGNITAGYFFGNGSQLTGITSSYGNANVVANLAALGSNPISTTGNISTGNIIVTGGFYDTGDHLVTSTAANANIVLTPTGTGITQNNGAFSASGNVTGGNLNAAGLSLSSNVVSALVSAANITTTANISGGNLIISGAIVDSAQLDIQTSAANANIVLTPNGTGNVNTGANVSVTGNITGGNILGGANVNATTHTGTTVSVTANVTGGNIIASTLAQTATLSATGVVTIGGTTQNVSVGTSQTTGTLILGGTSQTGFIQIGRSTASQALNLANGVTGTGNTKTVSIGENGAAGSTTTIAIGPVTATTAAGTATFNTATVVAIANTSGTALSVAGNITGGNILGGANVNATTHTGTTVSVSANVTGGNLITGALTSTASLSVTGNTATITTANISIGYLNIPQISLAANATAALVDSGKHFYSTTAGNLQITIPDNANVAFPVGTALSLVVQAAGNVLVVTQAGTTLYFAGNSTAGNRVVSTYGMATIMKVATNTWFINGTGVT